MRLGGRQHSGADGADPDATVDASHGSDDSSVVETAERSGANGADPDATVDASRGSDESSVVETASVTASGEVPVAARDDGEVALPERYQDLRSLGRGGFGEVRRVYDRELSRVVALKLLRPHVRDAPRQRARFLAEIKLAAGLNHPGIIAILDHGELSDGQLWFTMPEVRGRTLRAVIDEAFAPGDGVETPVRRRRLLDVFARVCEAVAYAHSRGVIHRDLKPENVMIGDFGRVMVMDWGLARRVGQIDPLADEGGPEPWFEQATPSEGGLTQLGEILGTPAYMPPEQARGDVARHGPSTDVYALGAILHHALTGRKPARGPDAAALADAGAAPELTAICLRAMAGSRRIVTPTPRR
ncbi:serine/threonine protein kinase [Minicystis rosea]|nr:serine/threonine protein kinase [Minicystis rosea]